ncbi:hypothetical protein Tco_1012937 [Tanacetum coccineum]
MEGSQYNKFRGDKVKVILVLVIRVVLLVLGETMQVDRQRLLNATTVKVKDIWIGNALSLSDQGMQHGIRIKQYVQKIIPNNAAFQTEDLDTYDSDCDDISNAKAVLMANISNYGSDVISEVPHSETYLNDMENQRKLALKEQVDSLEQNLSKQIKEKECLLQTFTVFKNESKEKENKYMENEIDLEKKIKELDNILFKKAQRIKPTLYDGIVISAKYVAMHVIDDEETLILEEESQSKIQSEDFRKRFTPQQELVVKQAFWFRISNPTIDSSNQPPVKVEVPSELPKVSLVNASLKKLKFHLAQFDSVVKKRTTLDARTEGEWGFEYTKAVFNNEIIPFLKSLKDIFNVFDKDLLNEIMEVQTVFDQMDTVVQ